MKQLIFIFLTLLAATSQAQLPAPQSQRHNTVLLQHGRTHIGNGDYIDNSNIGIKDGKILFVKNSLTQDIDKTEWDTIIDLNGKHVYPGFIAPNVTVGLTEIDAVRATKDFRETGSVNPHVRALVGYNLDSEVMYTVRSNGVLVTQSTPRGGLISGTSSIMALDGWTWEDAVYKADDGVHINWPRKYTKTGWWSEPGATNKSKNYDKVKNQIWDFFKASEGYSKSSRPEVTNLKYEAMRGVFKGKKRLFIHADFAPELNDIIDFSRAFNIKFPVIVGGYDAHYLAHRLKENHFSVMIGRPHSLPKFEDDLVNSYYTLASKLQTEGIPFCIQNAGDMEAMGARNLPFLAGTAWAYGLSEEQAVSTITLNTAKILGVDEQIGSLEQGKDATLYVSEGNALDMRTNKGYLAMIKGNFVSLDNHQKQLYEKYKKRYGLVDLD